MKIICTKCQTPYDSIIEWEFSCRDKHNWENWEGDQYFIITEEAYEQLAKKSESDCSECQEDLEGYEPYKYEAYPYWYIGPDGVSIYDKKKCKYYKYPYDYEEIKKHPYALDLLKLAKYLVLKKTEKLLGRVPNEESLRKQSSEGTVSELVSQWLSKPTTSEGLARHIDSELERLTLFLENKTISCPICGSLDINEQLSRELYPDLEKHASKYNIRVNLNGKESKVDLARVLHLLSYHKAITKAASETGLLTGIESLLKKGSENLSDISKELIFKWAKNQVSPKEELSTKTDPFLEWLKSKKESGKRYSKD